MKMWIFLCAVVLLLPLRAFAEGEINKGDVLGLDRCVELALQNHPGILAAKGNVDVSFAKKGQAEAGYYPQVNASLGYKRFQPATNTAMASSSSKLAGTGVTRRSFWEYTTDLTATQTIFDFWKTSSQVKIQKYGIQSSQADLREIEDSVVFGVKQAYFNVLKARRNRAVAVETVGQFEKHLEQAKGFFEVGTKPKFDVTRAEVDLGNAKINLVSADNALKLAVVTLNNAMGLPDAPEYTLEDNLSFHRYVISLQEAMDKAYENRPDLKSIAFRKKASDESISLAKKGYLPVLTGSAGYAWAGHQFREGDGWSAGVALTIPIFSGFSTKYQVSEAKANTAVVSANEESLRQSVVLEVQQALLNLQEAEERIGLAELTLKQAEENSEIANGRYAAGVGNPIEVTDAEVALSNAKLAHNQALYDYKVFRASIEKAIGRR